MGSGLSFPPHWASLRSRCSRCSLFLTARFKRIASPHGLDTILQFHREAGLVAVGFALLHPIVMIVSAPPYLEFLDPRVMF